MSCCTQRCRAIVSQLHDELDSTKKQLADSLARNGKLSFTVFSSEWFVHLFLINLLLKVDMYFNKHAFIYQSVSLACS